MKKVKISGKEMLSGIYKLVSKHQEMGSTAMHIVVSIFDEINEADYLVAINGSAAHKDIETILSKARISINGVKARYKNGCIEPVNLFHRLGLFLPKIKVYIPGPTKSIPLPYV